MTSANFGEAERLCDGAGKLVQNFLPASFGFCLVVYETREVVTYGEAVSVGNLALATNASSTRITLAILEAATEETATVERAERIGAP